MSSARSIFSEFVKHFDNLMIKMGGFSKKLPGSTVIVKLNESVQRNKLSVSPFVCSNEATLDCFKFPTSFGQPHRDLPSFDILSRKMQMFFLQ